MLRHEAGSPTDLQQQQPRATESGRNMHSSQQCGTDDNKALPQPPNRHGRLQVLLTENPMGHQRRWGIGCSGALAF